MILSALSAIQDVSTILTNFGWNNIMAAIAPHVPTSFRMNILDAEGPTSFVIPGLAVAGNLVDITLDNQIAVIDPVSFAAWKIDPNQPVYTYKWDGVNPPIKSNVQHGGPSDSTLIAIAAIIVTAGIAAGASAGGAAATETTTTAGASGATDISASTVDLYANETAKLVAQQAAADAGTGFWTEAALLPSVDVSTVASTAASSFPELSTSQVLAVAQKALPIAAKLLAPSPTTGVVRRVSPVGVVPATGQIPGIDTGSQITPAYYAQASQSSQTMLILYGIGGLLAIGLIMKKRK